MTDTREAELQLWFDVRTAADQLALAKWSAAHPTASSPLIPEHADLVIWLLDQLAGVNSFEKTDAGVIDWRMEAQRANRLLAAAQRPADCDDIVNALRAIIVRCDEGDKKSDWLPIISSLAKSVLPKALAMSSTDREGK